MRNRAYRRMVRARSIKHKKYISEHVYGFDWYKVDGRYSKGKIHCSCPLCTYSKFYNLPTLAEEKDKEFVKDALNDYYKSA